MSSQPARRAAAAPSPSTATAVAFTRELDRGEWAAAAARVAPVVASGTMSADKLKQIWSQVTLSLGPLRSLGEPAESREGERRVVDLPARFERAEVSLRVVLDSAQRVAGFWIAPARPPAYVPPGYVDTSSFRETALTIGADPALPAVLTLPRSASASHRVPAVVLVHGSGPNDRDERVGGNRPFKDLAWGLASRGVAVLRYDKRTFAHPASAAGAPPTLEWEMIGDALAALRAVRAAGGVDASRVALVGHSLGGTFAPLVAQRDGRVAAVVMIAPSARPIADVALQQLDYLASLPESPSRPRAQLDQARAQMRALQARSVPATTTVLGAPASYWYGIDDAKPVDAMRAWRRPALALFGGRDYQVTAADEATVREALAGNPAARVVREPALSHLLVAGSGMATPEEYASRPGHVAAGALDQIARFVLAMPPLTPAP